MPTKDVFVVDSDAQESAALSQCLVASGFTVSEFRSAESFLERRPFSGPACVVLDYHLPGLSGLELQRTLRADSALSIVFVTDHGDVSAVVDAMKSGAVDFLTKPVDTRQLVAAVTRGLERSGRTDAARRIHDVFVARVDRLTRREREVATGVVQGLLNKEIASELGTTERTVKVHRGRVMAKLEVGSVAQLVRLVEHVRRSSDVLIDSAARFTSRRAFETRRNYSPGAQPRWRSTC